LLVLEDSTTLPKATHSGDFWRARPPIGAFIYAVYTLMTQLRVNFLSFLVRFSVSFLAAAAQKLVWTSGLQRQDSKQGQALVRVPKVTKERGSQI